MHSTLFQVEDSPIVRENFLTEQSIRFGNDTEIDYLYERTDKQRKELIKVLAEEILPHGMFVVKDEDRIVYQGGYEDWAEKWVNVIREKAGAITIENVFDWIGPTYQLQKVIENPIDCGTLFCLDGSSYPEKSAEMMNYVKRMKKGESLYIGSVFGFHW